MSRVPYLDLRAQYRSIAGEVNAAIAQTVESGQFVLGPAVQAFERDFAALCRTRHCIAVNSGTSALHLAFLVLGIGPGDEVIVPAMTFIASTAAVEYAGARPVLVDVEPGRWTLDPAELRNALSPRTKAILPVHLHGLPADMEPIQRFADEHGLAVIEDAAQAHGASYRGRPAGKLGRLGCFSFYPGKNLGAYGEAGAVVTDDDALATECRLLRDWGAEQKYRHVRKGFNYRMDGIQGAVLGVKLRHLPGWIVGRRRCAARYDRRFSALGIKRPVDDPGHVYHVYSICVPRRDELRTALSDRGIDTGIHYPIPLHLQPANADLGNSEGDFPVSEALAGSFLSLPLYPELDDASVDRVATAVEEALGAAKA